MNPSETAVMSAIEAPVETRVQPEGAVRPLLVLIFAYLLITAWNLDLQSIANPDEPRYAVPARIMIESHDWNDWLVPQFNTQPRLLKPIFFYWLIAATGIAGKAAGLDLASALRIGPLLMGLLAVIGTYLLGRRLFGPRAAFIAAVILMTTYFFHEISRELVVDMTLSAWLLWAWLFCFIALERIAIMNTRIAPEAPHAKSPALPLLGFYLCLGLACMTKGPVLVALFVVVPLLFYLWWDGRLSHLLYAGLWWGFPIAIAAGCWWFVVMQQSGVRQGNLDMFGILTNENLSRAAGNKDHQEYAPFLFYFMRLGAGFAPWCILFPFAAWWTLNLAHVSASESEDSGLSPVAVKFVLSALVIPFFILGIIISKRELYILPLYPFIALWLGAFWERTFLVRRESEPAAMGAAGLVMLALVLLASTAILCLLPQKWGGQDRERILVAFLGCGIVIGLFAAAGNLKRGARYAAVLQLLSVAAALGIGYEAVVRPMRERKLDNERFYAALREKLGDRDVVLFGYSSNEAIWYLDRRNKPIDDVRRPELKKRFFEAPGTILVASRAELDKSPELVKSLRLDPALSDATIKKGKDLFILAVPDPEHPPDESVFIPKSKKDAPSQNDESSE